MCSGNVSVFYLGILALLPVFPPCFFLLPLSRVFLKKIVSIYRDICTLEALIGKLSCCVKKLVMIPNTGPKIQEL